MLHLLLLIISYGAFLLLLMPASGAGIISTAEMLAIGIGLIVYKKIYKVPFWKNTQHFLLSAAIFIAAAFGLCFYIRWIPSSTMQAIAAMLHMPIELMILIGSVMLSGLSLYFLYALVQMIVQTVSDTAPQNELVKILVFCIAAAAVTVMLSQRMAEADVVSMGYFNFGWCVLIVSVAILFIFCLIGRMIPSIFIGAGTFMVISTISSYIYKFRGRLLEPVDVFSAGTAMNVAENYSLLPIPPAILTGWGIFASLMIALCCLQRKSKAKPAAKKRYVLLAICVISSVAISVYAANLQTYHWDNEGAIFNGYVLDFVSKFKEITAPKPDNYSTELIDKLADQYAADSNEHESEPSALPHIIVIMDESFSDLSVVGELQTNMEVMPFISSLHENTISGYTLASVFGGNTANSEYEFLTGNSLAWLSPNVVPYLQYIRSSTYSMVSYLKTSYNYKCIAMHPFESSGWNRPAAYEHLGFDESYFVEDFPQRNYVREYISDQEMFDFMIETFEAQKDNPLFLFGVTMQNHGGYFYDGENYTKSITLNEHGSEFPEAEQYLSVIHETDKAVERLITYFQGVDEDVVIVFFGDHQPKINDSFYDTISGTTADTLNEKQKRYEIPFFVWANYDIEEEYIDRTSLNYLSSYVYDAAGITLPPYNQFLVEMEEVIPAINANGFYSMDDGGYLTFDEAKEEERVWLESYKALQYNNIFDKTNRNETLFPVLAPYRPE